MRDPLLNEEFLNELYRYTEREVYAKVILLSFFDETPMEEIQGRVTTGSVSVNGASALRRTCKLTLVTTDMDINAFHWGLHSKFYLEIGLKNFVDTNNYEDIVWFPMGMFIITNLSTAQALNNFTMSIQGQDKMCLLNGSCGGAIGQTTNLGQYIYDDIELNKEVRVDRKLKDIVFDLVHTYGLEPIQNIIINDIDNYGIELLEYRGETPLYLFKKYWDGMESQNNHFENMSTSGDQEVFAIEYDDNGDEVEKSILLKDFEKYYTFDTLNDKEIVIPTKVYLAHKSTETHDKPRAKYILARIKYGETAGYRPTDLIYPGEFIANPGEAITAQLDKIVKVLGDFEYFYDVYGKFRFQRKQTFINTPWNGTGSSNGETYFKQTGYESCYKFSFDNGTLITSFNNSPNISNMKNDYFVHGIREGVGGGEIPIHMRYAIAKKPEEYTTIAVNAEAAGKYGNMKAQDHRTYRIEDWDWREIIYQMARDKYQYGTMDDFFARVRQANRIYPEDKDLFPSGSTGYEMFYTDLMSYWRELYDPNAEVTYEYMTSPITGNKIQIVDDLLRPIYSPYVDENGLMTYSFDKIELTEKQFNDGIDLNKYYVEIPYQVPEELKYQENLMNEKVWDAIDDDSMTQEEYEEWLENNPLDFGTTYYYRDGGIRQYKPLLFDSVRIYQQLGNCYRDKIRYRTASGLLKFTNKELEWSLTDFTSPTLITATSTERDPNYAARLALCADPKFLDKEYQLDVDKKTSKALDNLFKELDKYFYTLLPTQKYNAAITEAKNIWNNIIQVYYCKPFISYVDTVYTEGDYGNLLGYKEKINYIDIPKNLIQNTFITPEEYQKVIAYRQVIHNEPIDKDFVLVDGLYQYTGKGETFSEYIQIVNEDMFALCLSNNNIYVQRNNMVFTNFNYQTNEDISHYYRLLGEVKTEYEEIISDEYVSRYETEPYFVPNKEYTMELITSLQELDYWKKVNNVYYYADVPLDNKYRLIDNEDTYSSDLDIYHKTDNYISGYHKTFSEFTDIYEYDAKAKQYLAVLTKGANGLYEFRLDDIIQNLYFRADALDLWGQIDPETEKPVIYCKAVKAYSLIDNENYLSGKEVITNEFTEYEQIISEEDFIYQQGYNNVFILYQRESSARYEPLPKKTYYTKTCQYFKPIDGVDKSLYYWNKNVVNSPELLNYWIDFLDGAELEKYSINIVGDRPKAVNDDKVRAIYYRDTPTVIFLSGTDEYNDLKEKGELQDGYNYIQLNQAYENMFSISAQSKDAHQVMDNLVFNHSYCVESVTIQSIPIYTLEPNTQVSVYDDKSKINGLYNITSLTIPLTHNGMMSIQATKVVDRIY